MTPNDHRDQVDNLRLHNNDVTLDFEKLSGVKVLVLFSCIKVSCL